MAQARVIKLVVSDVDGTLVTGEKLVTSATVAAAHRLRDAGIHLALVSSRPPRGMAFLTVDFGLQLPLSGFNGATVLSPVGAVLTEQFIPIDAVRTTIDLLTANEVEIWVFSGNQWFVRSPEGAYVARERRTVRFDPTVVDDFSPYVSQVGKVVGASADFVLLARCEAQLQRLLGSTANARRSQRYYLDITSPIADKGTAAQAFAEYFGVDMAQVCAIGDQENDLPMFRVAGHSVAMGNAPPSVAGEAMYHTASNDQDGWAAAIDRFVLA